MKYYIGLDVSMKETSICILEESGQIGLEKDVITAVLQQFPLEINGSNNI